MAEEVLGFPSTPWALIEALCIVGSLFNVVFIGKWQVINQVKDLQVSECTADSGRRICNLWGPRDFEVLFKEKAGKRERRTGISPVKNKQGPCKIHLTGIRYMAPHREMPPSSKSLCRNVFPSLTVMLHEHCLRVPESEVPWPATSGQALRTQWVMYLSGTRILQCGPVCRNWEKPPVREYNILSYRNVTQSIKRPKVRKWYSIT